MGFSRLEYWSGLPFPPPGDLPDPGIKPESLTFLALAGGFPLSHQGNPTQLSLEGSKMVLQTLHPRCEQEDGGMGRKHNVKPVASRGGAAVNFFHVNPLGQKRLWWSHPAFKEGGGMCLFCEARD